MSDNTRHHTFAEGEVPVVTAVTDGLVLTSHTIGIILLRLDQLLDIEPRDRERMYWRIDTGHTLGTTIRYGFTFKTHQDSDEFRRRVEQALLKHRLPEPVVTVEERSPYVYGDSNLFEYLEAPSVNTVCRRIERLLKEWFPPDSDAPTCLSGEYVDATAVCARVREWIPTLSAKDMHIIANAYVGTGQREYQYFGDLGRLRFAVASVMQSVYWQFETLRLNEMEKSNG